MTRWILCFSCLLVVGLVHFTSPVVAQEDPSRKAAAAAQVAAAQLQQAGQLLRNAEGARDRIAALTATVTAYENGLMSLRSGLRQLAVRERALSDVFEAKRQHIANLLSVLSTMESAAAPVLLLHPSGPIGTARSGQMIAELTPTLQAEADALRFDLETLNLLRNLQETSLDALHEGLRGAQQARTELANAMSERRELPRRFVSDRAAMQALLTNANTLSGFASGLAELPEAALGLTEPVEIGALGLPVSGRIIRGFEESDAAGIVRPGWVLATLPGSMVTAPTTATVRYAGPLLDYGKVIILEPVQGALLVLAGMEQVFGSEGVIVEQGDPVGLMGGTSRNNGDFMSVEGLSSSAEATETLYIETRQSGRPVDPATWFAR